MRSNIDDSLNLLKELEVKLKNKVPESKSYRFKTQQDEPTPKRDQPWGEKLVSAYEHIEGKLEEENKQLKKYINKLIRMNDYLKNQLIRGEKFSSKYQINSDDSER